VNYHIHYHYLVMVIYLVYIKSSKVLGQRRFRLWHDNDWPAYHSPQKQW